MNRILIADDDPGILSALEFLLEPEGFAITCINSPSDALNKIKHERFDLAILDLNYSTDTTSGQEGMQLIQAIREVDELIPLVVMSGWGNIDTAVRAMQHGANDFIQKPWENERLLSILRNQINLAASQKQALNQREQKQILHNQLYSPSSGKMVCESKIMQHTMDMLVRVAKTDATVLLRGENGTGKSVFANIIHLESQRNNGEFISVNMGAVPEALFESEMFGHVKGAFTDAKNSRIGRFELAEGGTLFLDEIANTPYSQQMKLLRVLEERSFEKVGSSKTQNADIRLICASNSDLEAAVTAGRFRQDLLYRINTVEITIPPLRERKEDILPLAQLFLKKSFKRNSLEEIELGECAKQALLQYAWPGNVRELSHVVERAVILACGQNITAEDLGLAVESTNSPIAELNDSLATKIKQAKLDDIEAAVLEQRLQQYDGNVLQAAKSLGLSRSAFYRRLNKNMS